MENIPHALKFFLSPNFSPFGLELQSPANAIKTIVGKREGTKFIYL